MKKIFAILLISAIGNSSFSQSITDKLKTAYAAFSKDAQLKYATSSLIVTDRNTNKVIFAQNENVGLAPASTLKTVTSATALAILGEDFQFKTDILYTGSISGNTLNGNIVIKGNGDPTLGSDRFSTTSKDIVLEKILSAIQSKGIKKVNGEVIADDGVWDSQSISEGWIWQDMGNYYGAGSSAICWGENEFELRFKPATSTGQDVQLLSASVQYPFLNIINELKTGDSGTGDQVYGYSSPYSSVVYLRGTYAVNLNKAIRFSLPDPALAFVYDVSEALSKNGISTKGYKTTRLDTSKQNLQGTVILSIQSPPLKDMVYHFNQKSLNLYGEQMLRAIANDEGKTIKGGIKSLQNHWQKLGIDKNTLNIYDGSGLAPANRVTSATMANVLKWADGQPWFTAYLNSFPLYNNMKMKSGTIGDVLAYSGYHKNYCFTIIVNNYSGTTSAMRQKMFTLLNNLK
ncbi:D-alanyl-D-alaninecarboxypeptidase/D-alanyl-D-alanine-endopeptidase [Pseudopedobacter saltans DSM 12145]|uniref:D-alanyl-D-alaninecarboxypeptidase/D-alanyl-D-alanine-endopeptidase n=1 Tax=Pseudopedobacter saltans (strain ATCC 51119 / DSM 12145 / JCM 21818 / CCUG 39354 / LMG 10337 / NBRC 100064 / NCIMB 13643) TaxID=762903 RepID=F0S792_PSESL|nr:D-alanyl-D-alanine carboxypeptidase/D-alanyl-D-alanine-endopeptidase [Pseudopedobacter saltans]ADY54365.1 D-alanyl-D-alaninecarboxypeptidase/D-alanyl-D-alanine-endopeptidase [Pseudopedobacter saltans DSM 12145]